MGALVATAPPARASHEVEVDRVAGADRFGTAAAIAARTYPGGAAVAFLARADDFADALAAAPFARQAAAPILLTEHDEVPAATWQALDDLGVEEVVLLGGTDAIGSAVEAELDQTYPVARTSGETRFETAAAVARSIAMAMDSDIGTLDGRRTVFVASGTSFPDALAAGAPAAAQDDPFPILLTPRDALHPAAAAVVDESGVEQAVIVGGTAVVGEQVAADLAGLGLAVRRLSGPTRLATAAAVADFTVANFDATGADAQLARGDLFPDALTAGPYAGTAGAPILLAAAPDRLGVETARWFDSACLLVRQVEAVGGTAAVAGAVLGEAAATARECHGSWGLLPDAPVSPRVNHSATWSGERMLLWGGQDAGFAMRDDGAAWEPDQRSWRVLPPAPIEPRWAHVEAWTGDELLVWGGSEGPDHLADCFADGAAYDPASGTWRSLPPAPGGGRCGAASVWTGTELILFGGTRQVGPIEMTDDAVAYDPATDQWRQIDPAPLSPRSAAVGAWTATEMLVFGGLDGDVEPQDDGAAYDPDTHMWREIADSALEPRPGLSGAWAGGELLVFGGDGRTDTAAYDQDTDTWREVADLPGPQGSPATAWTGAVLYVVGGAHAEGEGPAFVAWVPGEDGWVTQPDPPGGPRSQHTAVWSGQELLVWGGMTADGQRAPGVTWRPPE